MSESRTDAARSIPVARADDGTACALQSERPEANVARYGETASKTVASAMRRRKRGTLRSSAGEKVTSREQAVAIGLSEARRKGGKVPARTGAKKR